MPNLAQIIIEAWDRELDESPDPFDGWGLYERLRGVCPKYREELDHQPRNFKGDLIPRIVTVRRHLRQLGPTRLNPARLPR